MHSLSNNKGHISVKTSNNLKTTQAKESVVDYVTSVQIMGTRNDVKGNLHSYYRISLNRIKLCWETNLFEICP